MDGPSLVERLPPDGRAARKDRNKRAVLDAVIELFSENNLVPDVHQVVDRSGVSLRSVYRYFEDRTQLLLEALERNRERAIPVARIPAIGEGSLDERIEALVAQRHRLYEVMGPTYRAGLTLAATREAVRAEFVRTIDMLSEQIRLQFAPELAEYGDVERLELETALDAACDFSSIDHLQRIRGLDAAASARVVERTLRGILRV